MALDWNGKNKISVPGNRLHSLTSGGSSLWGRSNIKFEAMAAAFLVASPDSEMVQHNRCCHRDIQRGCALAMLRNVHKSVTELQLSSR